jgi:hypothetical protein
MKKLFIIHPLLFAIYPVLFLYSHNIEKASFSQAIEPLIFLVSSVLILQIIFFFVFKNKKKAALFLSFFLMIFFTYGNFHQLVEELSIAGFRIGRNKYLLIIWFIFFVGGAYLIHKIKNFDKLTSIINVTAVVLIVIPIINIVWYSINKESTNYNISDYSKFIQKYSGNNKSLPNVYDIILDGYASSNSLKDFYHFDNLKFENYLKEQGFHIISDCRSNYAETRLAFASYLNMKHINVYGDKVDFPFLNQLVQNNSVMQIFKFFGYKTVNISSNIGKIQNLKNVDWNVKCGSFLADEFQSLIVQMSILSAFKEKINLGYFYRQKILRSLSKLGEVHQNIESPFFVFAHILPPHPPYVFGRNAEPMFRALDLTNWEEAWQQKERYTDQVIFVNNEIKKVISKILLESETEPIIIIHADHGPQLTSELSEETAKARMRIFYAYYLPKNEKNFLVDLKTPINTYPFIFNHYFGSNFEFREDRSYYTNYTVPLKFTDVTDLVIETEKK